MAVEPLKRSRIGEARETRRCTREAASGEFRTTSFDPHIRKTMRSSTRFTFKPGSIDDAPELAALHTAVADHLTDLHGQGPWSGETSEKGVLYAMRQSSVFVARQGREIVGTLRLATKKPWAIDAKYFSKCNQPLYLLAMAILPQKQRQGLGRRCLDEALEIARAWPADAIRLDAYDATAGAGGFYARCGYSERGRVTYRNTPLIYYERLVEG
jgi:GNAT superfamily N-acetyltransferase